MVIDIQCIDTENMLVTCWGGMGEGVQKIHTSSYKINTFLGGNVHPSDYS